MNSFEINKIITAILVTILVVFGIGKISDVIFDKNDNDEEQEINLNNVLLLNPQNDEAIYMLTLLKIKQSNYDDAKKLIDKFIKDMG